MANSLSEWNIGLISDHGKLQKLIDVLIRTSLEKAKKNASSVQFNRFHEDYRKPTPISTQDFLYWLEKNINNLVSNAKYHWVRFLAEMKSGNQIISPSDYVKNIKSNKTYLKENLVDGIMRSKLLKASQAIDEIRPDKSIELINQLIEKLDLSNKESMELVE